MSSQEIVDVVKIYSVTEQLYEAFAPTNYVIKAVEVNLSQITCTQNSL
jgi:hypothetical protein